MKYTVLELINNVCERSYRNSGKNLEKIKNCGLEDNKKYQLFDNYSIKFVAHHGGIKKVFYKGEREVKKETVLKAYKK